MIGRTSGLQAHTAMPTRTPYVGNPPLFRLQSPVGLQLALHSAGALQEKRLRRDRAVVPIRSPAGPAAHRCIATRLLTTTVILRSMDRNALMISKRGAVRKLRVTRHGTHTRFGVVPSPRLTNISWQPRLIDAWTGH